MLALYCPDVPPVKGGLPDHTRLLARALQSRGQAPVVFASRGSPDALAPIPCVTGLSPADVAREAAQRKVTGLIVQYVPFLYGRRGISWALCRAARDLKRAGTRLGLLLHEPYVPFTRLPWLLTGWPQRWQLRYLVRRSSQVYSPVPAFADIARRYARPETGVSVQPVGANYEAAGGSRQEARASLGIPEHQTVIGVFSPAASGFLMTWLAAAVERLRPRREVLWLVFGNGSDGSAAGLPAGEHVRALGILAPEALGRALKAIDMAAQPYGDGLTRRRGSAMLMLAAGNALVSSRGHLLDPKCAEIAACESDAAAFAARVEQLAMEPLTRAGWASRAMAARDIWSVDPLAEAIVRDFH